MVQCFSEVKELSLRLGASTTRLSLPALMLLFLSGSRAQAGLIHVEPAFPSFDLPQADPSPAKPFDLFLGNNPEFAFTVNDMSVPAVTQSADVADTDENADFAKRFPFSSETCLPFALRVMTKNGSPAPGGPSTHSNPQEGSSSCGPTLAQIVRGRYLRANGGLEPCRPFVVGLFRPPRNVG
jgi:hypothetical protein